MRRGLPRGSRGWPRQAGTRGRTKDDVFRWRAPKYGAAPEGHHTPTRLDLSLLSTAETLYKSTWLRVIPQETPLGFYRLSLAQGILILLAGGDSHPHMGPRRQRTACTDSGSAWRAPRGSISSSVITPWMGQQRCCRGRSRFRRSRSRK
jgi:hypothetical protein